MATTMAYEDLIGKYNLDKAKLFTLLDCIITFLKERGIVVSYTKLDQIIEVDIYKIDRTLNEEDKHHETCLSDGMEVWLHDEIEEIGGITGRLYDILHVGCGHLYQWSANSKSQLKFFGNTAWRIGSTDYLSNPTEEKIQEAWDYEQEAGLLALANLNIILTQNNFEKEFSKSCSQLFCDYMNTDLEYITTYYRSGLVKNFFEKWQFNTKPSREININFPLHMQRRTNKCVALLSVRSE